MNLRLLLMHACEPLVRTVCPTETIVIIYEVKERHLSSSDNDYVRYLVIGYLWPRALFLLTTEVGCVKQLSRAAINNSETLCPHNS